MNRVTRKTKLVRILSEHEAWKDYDESDERFVEEFPKIELHIHLDGSFDPLILWKYLQEHPESIHCFPTQETPPWDPETTLPIQKMIRDCQTAADFHDLCTCRGYRSLNSMLNCFSMFLPLVRRNLELLEQLAYDFSQRQAEQNIVYTEVRYSPFLLAQSFDEDEEHKVDGPAVFQAITRGLRKGCAEFGVTINQIMSAIAFGPDWAMPSLELAHQHRDAFPCAIVGVDIAAGEDHFNEDSIYHDDHYAMTQRARELDIPISLHAGEASHKDSVHHVRLAIDKYGARRIGHGYRVVLDEELMQLCKRDNIHFEVCPTSSDETGGWMYEHRNWQEHPCLTMHRQELSFSLSSDDPAVFHTSLAWQYRLALVKMGLTRADLVRCNLHAVEAAFVSQEEKRRLRTIIELYSGSFSEGAVPDESPSEQKDGWRRSMSENYADREFVDRVFVRQGKSTVTEYL